MAEPSSHTITLGDHLTREHFSRRTAGPPKHSL
jgi:hypothetical protein